VFKEEIKMKLGLGQNTGLWNVVRFGNMNVFPLIVISAV
jgi:hypothetical protein